MRPFPVAGVVKGRHATNPVGLFFPHRRHRDLNGWNEMWEEKGGETEMSALTVSDCDRKIDKHEKHKEDAL